MNNLINRYNNVVDWRNIEWTCGEIGASAGVLYKNSSSIDKLSGKRIYKKLPSIKYSGSNIIMGYEAVYEVIAFRIDRALGIPCTKYKLQKASVKIENKEFIADVAVSLDYKNKNDKAQTVRDYMINNRYSEISKNKTFIESIDTMQVFDYIIDNKDRHPRNIEIITDTISGNMRVAPTFDNGGAFIKEVSKDASKINDYNVLVSETQSCCTANGENNLVDAVLKINSTVKINKIVIEDKETIFKGLIDSIPVEYANKIFEMVTVRQDRVRELNSKIIN